MTELKYSAADDTTKENELNRWELAKQVRSLLKELAQKQKELEKE